MSGSRVLGMLLGILCRSFRRSQRILRNAHCFRGSLQCGFHSFFKHGGLPQRVVRQSSACLQCRDNTAGLPHVARFCGHRIQHTDWCEGACDQPVLRRAWGDRVLSHTHLVLTLRFALAHEGKTGLLRGIVCGALDGDFLKWLQPPLSASLTIKLEFKERPARETITNEDSILNEMPHLGIGLHANATQLERVRRSGASAGINLYNFNGALAVPMLMPPFVKLNDTH
mmetsp:Transcript_19305/g.51570  ORF Transcript_19305/g.51570 Transcript_19305/m.51570 type:complete len:227 (-) Transcript_19305:36-716(-)